MKKLDPNKPIPAVTIPESDLIPMECAAEPIIAKSTVNTIQDVFEAVYSGGATAYKAVEAALKAEDRKLAAKLADEGLDLITMARFLKWADQHDLLEHYIVHECNHQIKVHREKAHGEKPSESDETPPATVTKH